MTIKKVNVLGIELCVSLSDSTWGIEKENTFYPLIDAKSCMFILPILEKSYISIKSNILNATEEEGLITDEFPYSFVVQAAIEYPSSSSYWLELAANWIDEGASVNDAISSSLNCIVTNKKYDQKLRHRFRSIINKLKKVK